MMDRVDPATGKRAVVQVDYWAVAPYFCGSPPASPASVSALLDICEASIDDTLDSARQIGDAARAYGVPLIAYEGGQHIRNDGAGDAAQTIYNLTNDDPRMGDLYTRCLDQWRDGVDGRLFALFSLVGGAKHLRAPGHFESPG